jgi:hypothetical protein
MLVLGPAPEDESVPSEMRGALCAAVVGCSVADPVEAEADLDLVRALHPPVDLFDRMPYTLMQSLFDAEFPARGDLHHMGGAVHRVGEMDTSFPNRAAHFTYNIVAKWQDPADDAANRDWARGLAAALQPYGEGRSFVSFLTEASDATSSEAAYGAERYARLADLKRRYDPNNVFRLNQNVRP